MPTPPPDSLPPIERLRAIVAVLRSPEGCPWDREQTHASLRAGLIEEAYEVIEAINRNDDANLCEELGDFLLQTVFHSQIADEAGRFTFDDAARSICEKLVRRHPHVFGDGQCADSAEVLRKWDDLKRAEKGARVESALDGVTVNGHPVHRLPHNLNMSFADVEAESLMMGMNDVAVSSGSACTSATLEPSYVLKAMGVDDERAHSSIRFGLGRFNTEEEIDYAAARVVETVTKMRELSPSYAQEIL